MLCTDCKIKRSQNNGVVQGLCLQCVNKARALQHNIKVDMSELEVYKTYDDTHGVHWCIGSDVILKSEEEVQEYVKANQKISLPLRVVRSRLTNQLTWKEPISAQCNILWKSGLHVLKSNNASSSSIIRYLRRMIKLDLPHVRQHFMFV